MTSKSKAPTRPDRCSNRAAILPVRFEEFGTADAAPKFVEVNGLEHRFYLLLEAGCAQIVNWLGPRVLGQQGVNKGSHVGLGQRVAFRFHLESLRLLRFVLHFQKGIIHRQIRLLAGDDLLVEVRDHLLQRDYVGFRSREQILRVFSDLGAGFERVESSFSHAEHSHDCGWVHSNRLLLGLAEGDEGVGERAYAPQHRQNHEPCIPQDAGVVMKNPTTDSLRAPVAAAVAAREPASPRVPPLTRRAGWRKLKDGYERLDDSLRGDAIGLACIIVTIFIFLIVTP